MGALSELPEVDHNMLFYSVIKTKKSRRSMKGGEDRVAEKRGFKKRRRKSSKKRISNCKKLLLQDGSYLAKLKEVLLKCRQVKELRLKKRRKSKYCFPEKELYYRERKRGINFFISPLIIYSLLFNLMQVLAQQYQQQNTSPIRVVRVFRPTIELTTTNDKDGLHFNNHYSGKLYSILGIFL